MGTVCTCMDNDNGAVVVELPVTNETQACAKNTLLQSRPASANSQEHPAAQKGGAKFPRKTMVLGRVSRSRVLAGCLSSEDGRQEFKVLFDRLDKNADGSVDLEEWAKLLVKQEHIVRKFFGSATIEQIKDAFNRIDQDHNGTVTFDELVHAAEVFTIAQNTGAAMQTEEGEKFFRDLFSKLDKINDGRITYQEFVRAMCRHGLAMQQLLGVQRVSKETLREAFDRIDMDGSQTITWDEFKAAVIGISDDK